MKLPPSALLDTPTPDQWPGLIVLTTVTLCYLIFHYLGSAKAWQSWGVEPAQAVFRQRLSGVVLLGPVPAVVAQVSLLELSPLALGLGRPHLGYSAAFLGLVAVVVLPAVRWNAGHAAVWDAYPEVRTAHWDRRLWWTNAATWAAYLLAYEFFFRGFFLVPLIAWAGLWP